MARPRVSVIIPAYNAEAHLARSARSVLGQTFRDFELLIVDDGSTDGTWAIAQSLAAESPERVRALQHPGAANHGVAAARNLAARHAGGTYLAYLDADDEWHADKLSRQVAFMDARPDVGITYTKANILREDAGHNFIPGVEVLGDAISHLHRVAMLQVITCSANYIFSTVMVRADALAAVGGFDEHLPFQSEDRIMVGMVCSRFGIALVPEVLCDYYAHGSSYTADVVRAGIGSVIFYDLQVRVLRWLKKNGSRKWAFYSAHRILPDSFVMAILCSRTPGALAHTLRAYRRSGLLEPSLLWKSPLNALRHCRIGSWLGMKKPRARRRATDASNAG